MDFGLNDTWTQVLDDREDAERARPSAVQLPPAQEVVPREEPSLRGSRFPCRPQVALYAQETSSWSSHMAPTSRNQTHHHTSHPLFILPSVLHSIVNYLLLLLSITCHLSYLSIIWIDYILIVCQPYST